MHVGLKTVYVAEHLKPSHPTGPTFLVSPVQLLGCRMRENVFVRQTSVVDPTKDTPSGILSERKSSLSLPDRNV